MNKKVELKVVPLTSIWSDNRFREDMGEIEDLAYSIKTYGVIQPLAVNRVTGPNGEEYKLLAGGRRFEACSRAGLVEVPVRIYPEQLNEYESRVIELEENIQRKNLTYIEDVNLKKEIHELYQRLYGGPKTSTKPDAEGWSLRDTASMLGKSHSTISEDITLAKAMEEFPSLEWERCKNKGEAKKMLKKFKHRILRAEIADQVEKSSPKQGNKLLESYRVGDFFEEAAKLPDRSFSIVEIDPPYAIDLTSLKHGDSIDLDVYNEVPSNEYTDFLQRTLSEAYRLMSNDGWLIFWFAPEPWFEVVYQLITKAGFKTRRLPALWIKPSGQTLRPDTYLASTYEPFFYASKGNPQIVLEKRGRSNTFLYSPTPPAQKIHPTERPVELMKDILSTFGIEGSRVLVPFAGSGNTLRAAHSLSMFPLGFDLSREYRDSYVARLLSEGGLI